MSAKYSGGSEIDQNYRDASRVLINLDAAVEFLNNIRMRNKKLVLADLRRNCERMKRDTFTASILNNLVVNHEAGSGKAGLAIVEFLVSQGVDASHERQSNEDWLVVFNPKIIKSYRRLSPKEDIVWDLPRITSSQEPQSSLPSPEL